MDLKIGLHEVASKATGRNRIVVICGSYRDSREAMEIIESKFNGKFLANYSNQFLPIGNATVYFISIDRGIIKLLGTK